jgi:Fe-S-cluster containining protein
MMETFYSHLEFSTKTGAWSVNLPFLCSQCGVCCILDDFLTAGPLTADLKEHPEIQMKLQTLQNHLAALIEAGEDQYDNYVLHTPCPFVEDKICSIYAIRPQGCRNFPHTLFGMQTTYCPALTRFKSQRSALRRGMKVKETPHFTVAEPLQPCKLSDKQRQRCRSKLEAAGATAAELALFEELNPLKQHG